MKTLTQLAIVALMLSAAGCATYSSGPRPNDHLSGVTLPNQLTMYAADQCIGAVVNSVCHGSVIGQPIGICHGSILAGRCLGVETPDYAHSNRLNTQPRTYQDMMEESGPLTYGELMQNSKAL